MLVTSSIDSSTCSNNISKSKVSQIASMFSTIMDQNRGELSINKKETQHQSQNTSSATKNRFVKNNKITTTTNKQSTFYGRRQTTTTSSNGTKISASSSSLIHQRSLSSSSLYSNPGRNDDENSPSTKHENQDDPRKNGHSNLMLVREQDADQEQHHQVISSSCHDISLLIDNKAKFCSAKALFEQLEKQSNIAAVKTLRNAEKLVISPSKMYNCRRSDQALALPSTTNRPSLRPPQLPPRHFNELMFTGAGAVFLNGAHQHLQKNPRPNSILVISQNDKNGYDSKNINNNNIINNDHKIVGNPTSAGSVFTLVGSPKISTLTTKNRKEESLEEKLESKVLDFVSLAEGVQTWKSSPAPPPVLPMENFTDRGLVEEVGNLRAVKRRALMEKFVKGECDQSVISATWRSSMNSTFRENRLETKFVNGDEVQKEEKTLKESVDGERSADFLWLKNGEIKSHSSLIDTFVREKMSLSGENVEQESSTCNKTESNVEPANEIMRLLRVDEPVDSTIKSPDKATITLPENAVLNVEEESTCPKSEVHYLPDGHFWMEIPGLAESSSSCSPSPQNSMRYKKPTKVSFSGQCMKVYSTYSQQDYDRRNDEIDPVSASAEYELERRLERMEILNFDVPKGDEGLGFSIIGMGVGADAGLEKLGIFVKSITPGGSVFKDGQIKVCDQIVEVDGQSLIGVSQIHAADVLRATSGVVKFKIGREKDPENSEIAQLIKQSLDQDKMVYQTSAAVSPKQLFFDQSREMQERTDLLPPPPPLPRPAAFNGQGLENSSSLSAIVTDENLKLTDDETPEQLVDSNPHIEQLMKQLRKAFQQPSELSTTSYCNNNDITNFSAISEKLNSDDLNQLIKSASAQNNSNFESSLDQFSRNNAQILEQQSQNFLDNQDQYVILDKETHFPNRCSLTAAESSSSSLTSSMTSSSFLTNGRSKSVCHVTSSSSMNKDGSFLATPTKLANSVHLLMRENLNGTKNRSSKYQALFDESTTHYVELEEKYLEAKNLIENYEAKERSYLEREESHLRSLLEKDKQYAALLKQLNDKVIFLENKLRNTYEKKFFDDRNRAAVEATINKKNLNSTTAATDFPENFPSTSSTTATTTYKATPACEVNSDVGGGADGDDSPPALAYLPSKKLLAAASSSVDKQSSGHVTAKTATFTMSTTSFSSRKVVENQFFDVDNRQFANLNTDVNFDRTGSVYDKNLADENEKSESTFNNKTQNSENSTQPLSIAQNCPVSATAAGCNYSRGSPPTPRRLVSFFAFKKKSLRQEHHVTLNMKETLLSTIEIDKSCFSNDIFQWKSEDVCKFLQTLGLDKYSPEFCINKIDGKKLLHLDGSKLKNIGVENQLDRALIKKGVKELKNELRKNSKNRKN